MNLSEIDKSMAFRVIDRSDVEWYSALQKPFSLHGVNYSEDEHASERQKIICKTYQTAIAEGDTAVSYINGRELFGEEDRELCTVDMCHPNDLGFYRMAKTVMPVLKKCLTK